MDFAALFLKLSERQLVSQPLQLLFSFRQERKRLFDDISRIGEAASRNEGLNLFFDSRTEVR